MIKNVNVKDLVKHCDNRGHLIEILRDDDFLLQKFGQLNVSLTNPGIIKAFHYHKMQDEFWFFASGNVQAVLYDQRDNSPTKGETNVFYMGDNNPILLFTPPGVAHGFRVLGQIPTVIVSLTTESFKSGELDSYPIAWDDLQIGFNWGNNVEHEIYR
jgi:dTDP-4-dehydrorhamnose 3,5-epimerase